MEGYKALKEKVESLEPDFKKFYEKDNHAAGTRVRKGMQELKTLANIVRGEVQNVKKIK